MTKYSCYERRQRNFYDADGYLDLEENMGPVDREYYEENHNYDLRAEVRDKSGNTPKMVYESKKVAFSKGYIEGVKRGYLEGVKKASEKNYQNAYRQGFLKGVAYAEKKAYMNGVRYGVNLGYNKGYNDCCQGNVQGDQCSDYNDEKFSECDYYNYCKSEEDSHNYCDEMICNEGKSSEMCYEPECDCFSGEEEFLNQDMDCRSIMRELEMYFNKEDHCEN